MPNWSSTWALGRVDQRTWMGLAMFQHPQEEQDNLNSQWLLPTQQSLEAKGISNPHDQRNVPKHLWICVCINHWSQYGISINPTHQTDTKITHYSNHMWFLWMLCPPDGHQTSDQHFPIKNDWPFPTNGTSQAKPLNWWHLPWKRGNFWLTSLDSQENLWMPWKSRNAGQPGQE